jgi:hypothetical protein
VAQDRKEEVERHPRAEEQDQKEEVEHHPRAEEQDQKEEVEHHLPQEMILLLESIKNIKIVNIIKW